MSSTIQSLLPLLTLLAGPLGSGALATVIIDALRRRYPQDALLSTPRYVRLFALALAGGIALAAQAALAAATGADVLTAVDLTAAAMSSAVVSQLVHALQLRATAPGATDAA